MSSRIPQGKFVLSIVVNSKGQPIIEFDECKELIPFQGQNKKPRLTWMSLSEENLASICKRFKLKNPQGDIDE